MATSFELSINNFLKKTEKRTEQIFQDVVVEFFGDVVYATPIDTGNLQANWYATADTPSSHYDPDTVRGTDDVLFDILDASKSKNMVAYMTNNAPYANRIENEGWSKQAPVGMVEPAFKNIKNKLAMGAFK